MVRYLSILASFLNVSCMNMLAKDDGQAFGDDLGRFAVGARLDTSSCGTQALDTPEKWDFEVVLSKDHDLVYWNTGDDAVEGTLDADGKGFSFSSETVVSMSESTNPRACSVVRRDAASGTFDDAEDIQAFEGSLTYRFTPKAGTDCADLVAGASFDELPCKMTYRMVAEKVSDR